ncbi:Sorbitol-6-phosphate 2-dehydrogenase [Klebsiella michiganensis]|uniref:Sorbitol-6-phosphate 2-dehydrogenase n=1 Tax=Klebsiella michiganensis TaxID=1134687 RepID=A0A7H4PDM3_9ENTR|nr:Sorbitol-6-phosphate 2-dehydrogenase [Klebsiella michiganensis]
MLTSRRKAVSKALKARGCYAATKAALNSFTRSWSKELGKHGIRVVGVAPGILEKTGLRTPEYEEAAGLDPQYHRRTAARRL